MILTTADVNVIVMDFPNKKGHEMVVPNEDGSYTIFINAGLNRESQLKAYEHAMPMAISVYPRTIRKKSLRIRRRIFSGSMLPGTIL